MQHFNAIDIYYVRWKGFVVVVTLRQDQEREDLRTLIHTPVIINGKTVLVRGFEANLSKHLPKGDHIGILI